MEKKQVLLMWQSEGRRIVQFFDHNELDDVKERLELNCAGFMYVVNPSFLVDKSFTLIHGTEDIFIYSVIK